MDNDGDGFVDHDAGGVSDPDPQCSGAFDNREGQGSSCSLGFELVPLLGALHVLGQRRQRGGVARA